MATSKDYITFTEGKGVLQSFVTGTLQGICEANSLHPSHPCCCRPLSAQIWGRIRCLEVQYMEVSLGSSGSQGLDDSHEDPAGLGLTIWVSICWWRDPQPQSRAAGPVQVTGSACAPKHSTDHQDPQNPLKYPLKVGRVGFLPQKVTV